MRTAFIETLCELACQDDRIWLLTGDLGFSVLEGFAARFPERYLNAGVAEQNMTGISAGLALCGNTVFTYSIANFPVMRCFEQVRNDVCYHNLNVKIVAVGGGLAYGSAGYTHHAVEDLAVMRVLPNMVVLAPGDPIEVRLATRAMAAWNGPCYLRLEKTGEPAVHRIEPVFEIGKAIPVRDGSDITLISTGGVLRLAVEASDQLAGCGLTAAILSMPCVQPLDEAAVLEAARRTGRVITIEEHGHGGLGSAVAEVLASAGIAVKFMPMCLRGGPSGLAGTQDALRSAAGISVTGILEAVGSLM